MKILIIGGGVSGICLAHQLEARNIDFKIITHKENNSSSVAAGMINPIVFRRMLKSWEADKLIPYLTTFYPKIEEKIKASFFVKMPIRRMFSSEEEAKMWKGRVLETNYNQYIDSTEKSAPPYVNNDFGNGILKNTSFIRSKTFVDTNRTYFESKGLLRYGHINIADINFEEGVYKDECFDQIIFAQGYLGKDNPFFSYLPLNQTKGELLDVETEEISANEILNRKCFVLPVKENSFKLGATFDWDTTDLTPTAEKKQELLDKYAIIANAQLKITNHITGIRPTVGDRRPLIGRHPLYPKLSIFNGLGTKGYMLAPYFSEHFCNYLFNGEKLNEEVNILRFEKRRRAEIEQKKQALKQQNK